MNQIGVRSAGCSRAVASMRSAPVIEPVCVTAMSIEGSEAGSSLGWCCTGRLTPRTIATTSGPEAGLRPAPERAEESAAREIDHAGVAAEHHRALPPWGDG